MLVPLLTLSAPQGRVQWFNEVVGVPPQCPSMCASIHNKAALEDKGHGREEGGPFFEQLGALLREMLVFTQKRH